MDSFDLAQTLLVFIASTDALIVVGVFFILYMGWQTLKAVREQERVMRNLKGGKNA